MIFFSLFSHHFMDMDWGEVKVIYIYIFRLVSLEFCHFPDLYIYNDLFLL